MSTARAKCPEPSLPPPAPRPPTTNRQTSPWANLESTLGTCCGATWDSRPTADAEISRCIGATTAWNEDRGDGDRLTTCPSYGGKLASFKITGSSASNSWFYSKATTSTACNAIKTQKCQTGLACPVATIATAGTTGSKPPPKKKKRVGHRRHSRMLLSE